MKYITTSIVAIGLMATAAHADSGVNVGTLTCRVEPSVGYVIGSHRNMECAYSSAGGKVEFYKGSLSRLGLDFGVTGNQTLVWAVLAPGKLEKGALKGNYLGATAEATVGVGVGANVLVGGMQKSVTLQPLSVSMQTGLNVVAAGTSLSLKPKK